MPPCYGNLQIFALATSGYFLERLAIFLAIFGVKTAIFRKTILATLQTTSVSVARFGLFRPNWSFQTKLVFSDFVWSAKTSFGLWSYSGLFRTFGLVLWSFLVFFLMNFWDFGLFEIFLLLSVNLAVLKIF